MGADNQQGRLDPWWIVGFIDGEGCFSISIIRNATSKFGMQIFPEFVVTQGAKSLSALQKLQKFFQCGAVYENRRHDNHRENIYRYCVRSIEDLRKKILPFFDQHHLETAKYQDYLVFRKVLMMMGKRSHLTKVGRERIYTLAATMNRRKVRSKTLRDYMPDSSNKTLP